MHEDENVRPQKITPVFKYDSLSFVIVLSKLSDGTIVDVNDAWVKMFGYTKNEAIGKTSLELGIIPDAETRALATKEIENHNIVRDMKMMLRTKTGEGINCLMNVDPLDIGGEKYLLTILEDVTLLSRKEPVSIEDKPSPI